jgi:hypothetical protein
MNLSCKANARSIRHIDFSPIEQKPTEINRFIPAWQSISRHHPIFFFPPGLHSLAG